MLSERSERKAPSSATEELKSRRHPDYLMRATWFDYKSPAAFLVTFSKDTKTPPLSDIQGNNTANKPEAFAVLSPLGKIVEAAILQLPKLFEGLQILAYSIMPDHVHIVIKFLKHTPYTLGRVIAKVKGLASAEYGLPIWTKGFNDKISFERNRTEAFVRYANDNPLRYFIKQNHQEFFKRKHSIIVDGTTFQVYGNTSLLHHPIRAAVRFSSKYTATELAKQSSLWEETIRQSGVLISPFIHPKEREIRDRGIEFGASIILIQDNGLPEKFKPSGRLFELCAEGRLLIVAPQEHKTRTAALSRQQCLKMNQLAVSLSGWGSEYQRE